MIKSWPLVTATIRSATPHDKMDFSHVAGLMDGLTFWVHLSRLIFKSINSHRVHFSYTYNVAGKIHVGFVNKFIVGNSPKKLYGKSVGQAIRIRYNPEKPFVSKVLAEDNRKYTVNQPMR